MFPTASVSRQKDFEVTKATIQFKLNRTITNGRVPFNFSTVNKKGRFDRNSLVYK
jgi:hypothetical protein